MDNPTGLVSVVKHLEKAAGQRIGYKLLEPFPCLTLNGAEPAIITIQNAGKIISSHVGLGDLTFIIAVTKHPPSTAGHIELRYGEPEVFVEVSNDVCGFPDAVLATLCHEISHKYLHANGIRYGSIQIEQEIMTDVAAVYLGLGKIMLNGCECEHVARVTANGETKTSRTNLRTGYIDRRSFAFVYRLICAMRRIPRETYMGGLTEAAKQAVLCCEQQYNEWFQLDFHVPSKMESVLAECHSVIENQQVAAAELDRTLRGLEYHVETLRSSLKRFHTPLVQAKKDLTRSRESSDPNPHLRFLENAETKHCIDAATSANEREIKTACSSWISVSKAKALLDSVVSKQVPPETEIVSCPIDNTRMRVPSGHDKLLVTCGGCHYKFLVSTRKIRKEVGILGSLRKAFGRKRLSA
jgi:hypothetical protein